MAHQVALEFAIAAGALTHGVVGDFNLAALTDVEAWLAEGGLDVCR